MTCGLSVTNGPTKRLNAAHIRGADLCGKHPDLNCALSFTLKKTEEENRLVPHQRSHPSQCRGAKRPADLSGDVTVRKHLEGRL